MANSAKRRFLDSKRDEAYFTLVNDLVTRHQSRYEQQAKELVRNRQLSTIIEETPVRYKLEFRGCSFEVSYGLDNKYQQVSWVRMGWRKSDKLSKLPLFFAGTEAKLLFKN